MSRIFASKRCVLLTTGCVILIFLLRPFFTEYLNRIKPILTEMKSSHQEESSSTGGTPDRSLLHHTRLTRVEDQRFLKEMVKVLRDRTRLPNEKKPVNSTRPCQLNGTATPACTAPCDKPLSAQQDDRLKKLLFSPKLTLSDQQRENIRSIALTIPENDIIIVSAASSNHFNEMQSMFHNLHNNVHPRLPNASVVLYDIGLTAEQRNLATLERARKMVIYQDSSIRWLDDIRVYVGRAEKLGVQLTRYDASPTVSAHTLKQTFDYLQEDGCAFLPFPEVQAGLALYKNDALIKRALLEPYTRCALEPSCMCPVPPSKALNCGKKTGLMHRCHRYDQSVLTILAAMLFKDDFYKFTSLEYSYVKPLYAKPMRRKIMPNYFKS